ncbi:MAG: hypothetical protein LW636_09725 [Planctomycetaceae bacterium]|jgi:thiol:disulfide interchange protein DsbD|nr:hypothetical protein [Planctomycetaceae bacterium]
MNSNHLAAPIAALVALAATCAAPAQSLPPLGGSKDAAKQKEPQTADDAVKVSAAVVGDAEAGATVRVAVAFDIHPGWHIYWENPGESGTPTEVQLELPSGCRAPTAPNGRARLDFPAPTVFEKGETTIGYEKRVVLSVPVTIGAEVPAAGLPVKAKVSFLVCKERCLMGSREIMLDLAKPSSDAALAKDLADSLAATPLPVSEAPKALGLAVRLNEVAEQSAVLSVTASGPVRFIPFETPGARLASGFVASTKESPLEVGIELSRESTLGGPLEVGGILLVGNDPRPYSFRLPVPAASR